MRYGGMMVDPSLNFTNINFFSGRNLSSIPLC
jgi:hypothetical protein